MIIVNSLYTSKMFKEAFPYLGKACTPLVLYPTIEDNNTNTNNYTLDYINNYNHNFVSLNRYERKKERLDGTEGGVFMAYVPDYERVCGRL